MILSDICPTIVKEWKKFLSKTIDVPNVMYAALDNCDMPFKNDVIDVVSSLFGFMNTEGDSYKALSEIYRVLKPGGMYVSYEAVNDKEHAATLPPHALATLKELFPESFVDFYQESLDVGFSRIENIELAKYSTKDDEGGLPSVCRELGVELIRSTYLRFCYKD